MHIASIKVEYVNKVINWSNINVWWLRILASSALPKVAPTGPITKANKSGQQQKMHDTKQMGFCFDGMGMRTWELLIKSQHQNWAQTLCFSSWNMEFRDKRKEQSKREIKAIEREQINKQNYINEDNGAGFRVPPSPNSYFPYTLYKKIQR